MPVWFGTRPPGRCHWYHDDGTKRMQRTGEWGCTHRTCVFVHPDDPKWDDFKPTNHPNLLGEKAYRAEKEKEEWERRERQPSRSERDLDRDREREREWERERERERDKDRERERERPRSPPRAGPSTPTGPSMPSFAYAASRDPRTRPGASSSSLTALPTTSINTLPLGAASHSDLPSKPDSAPTLSRRGSMPRAQTLTAASTALPCLGRSDPAMSRTASTGARDSVSSSFDRASYRDRDKERERDRDRDRYRDRSPSSTASSEPRSRLESGPSWFRQDSMASTLAPQSPAIPSARRSATPSAMPPPPPRFGLQAMPTMSAAPFPVTTPTQSLAKTELGASRSSPTHQDKIQIWADRVKTMAEAVQARMHHVLAERELTSLRTLANSKHYVNLSEAARERMERKLKEAEEHVTAKKAELNRCVYKLVDNDFWDAPLRWQGLEDEAKGKVDAKGKRKEKEPSWDSKESTAEQRSSELRAIVWQVRDSVAELYKMMDEVRGMSSSVSIHNAPTGDQEGGGDKRPTKRRRVFNARAEDSISAEPSSAPTSTAPATAYVTSTSGPTVLPMPPQEVEDIMGRIADLDERVVDLENTMVQFDSDVLNELELRMEERFREMSVDGLGLNPDSSMDVDKPSGADTGQNEGEAVPQKPRTLGERLQGVEHEVQKAGEEIYQLAVEIGEIIKSSQTQESEVAKLRKENEELRARIVVMEQQQQKNDESIQTFKAEMEALNVALQAYIARAPTPPPAPPPTPPVPIVTQQMPDMQSMADTITPMVLESVRNDLRPLLDDLTSDVQQMITRQNTQVAQTLMSKLQLTLKTVEVIYAWMNQHAEAQMPQPAAPAVASPSIPHQAQTNGGHGSNGVSALSAGANVANGAGQSGPSLVTNGHPPPTFSPVKTVPLS